MATNSAGFKVDRVKLNNKGFQQLRTSAKARSLTHEVAKSIAEACGDGYMAADTELPRNRARSAVIAVTARARRDNARNQTMIRNLHAGRR